MSYTVTALTKPIYLGEGPHWDHREQALYFVGTFEKKIHKYVPTTGTHTFTTLEGRPGFIIPVEGAPQQFVVALERQFVIIQWDGAQDSRATVVKVLGTVDQDKPKNNFNDGKVDPRGRLFAGTLEFQDDLTVREPKGALYRIDSSRSSSINKVADKIWAANGLAWDLMENAFYYIDSRERKIRRYDYDAETGNISNLRYIFDLHANGLKGVLDGCTVDTDGNLWVAIFGESCVIKVDPRTGTLLDKILIPSQSVTSVTFGGPNLDVLFVTTARFALGDIKKELPPPNGATFMVTGLGVKGHPNRNFKL